MSSDYTQQQSPADEQRSRDLSLARTRPPTEVPGYAAQRFLGAGAYGEVWAGVDKNTGRKVAIKFYAHRRGVDWSLLSREVEKLVFLSADRYVVQLLQVGWEAEPPFYVMELVENGSLEDLLKAHGTFSVPEAVEMFREIAIGLNHAHGRGVLHCDLKPANILLDQDHRPRLADFGQSRLSHEQKPALGTLFYMAPEQAALDAVPDVRWDVYALGAILYCLLVGSPPYRDDETVKRIETSASLSDRLARYRQEIRSAPAPQDHRQIPGMDRHLAELIDRCLSPDPERRFANVQEVLDALAAREKARTLRRMTVLGLVGPLAVLLVAAVFSWQFFASAMRQTEDENKAWAGEINKFAAQLAAEKVTGEIGRYFRIIQEEASQADLTGLIPPAGASQLLPPLANASLTPEQREQAQAAYLADEPARRLTDYLKKQLGVYLAAEKRDRRAPKFDSMFVTDRTGTQLAAFFADDTPKGIGLNFAHRSYFHGGSSDLDRANLKPDEVQPISRATLSAVFKSTSTGRWKVAVSAPIYENSGQEKTLLGVLVLTINLGDFELFRDGGIQRENGAKASESIAVLVDGRPGHTGTILQHPLFDEIRQRGGRLPPEFVEPKYLVNKNVLSSSTGRLYEDPLAQHPLGIPFRGRWIAAAANVAAPLGVTSDGGKPADTGLVVLVQSSYDSVVDPVRQLARRFLWNFALMLAVVMLAGVAVWLYTWRYFREPAAAVRPAPAKSTPTPLHGAATLPAPKGAGQRD
ncbi:MAG TPA: serine/threonine protein kinase [Pirellulaceae bacterium]|nr:serine/threonine protein kinase [Pirellulaceae bacterium]